MRFIHTADWHLGRYFHGVHLTGDQRQLLLEEFLPLVKESKAEAVVIAGDIYDRGVPPVEAVDLFSEVLTKLVEQKVKVLYIAGNHDSAARVGFGSTLLAQAGVYVRGELTRDLAAISGAGACAGRIPGARAGARWPVVGRGSSHRHRAGAGAAAGGRAQRGRGACLYGERAELDLRAAAGRGWLGRSAARAVP